MRQIQDGSWSHYAPYVAMKFKLTEAQAQLATLQSLGDAIKQERQLLQQAMDQVDRSAVLTGTR